MRQGVTGICKAGTRPLQTHLLYGGQVQVKSIHKVDLRGSSWEDQLALPEIPKEPGHSKLAVADAGVSLFHYTEFGATTKEPANQSASHAANFDRLWENLGGP